MSSRAYPARPLIGVGAIVLRGDAVLLVRRAKPPAAGTWSLPGGAQRVGETAEEGARRELTEETGVAAGPMVLVAHVDSITLDADGKVEYHYTILDFAARWTSGEPQAGGDVSAAEFVEFADLGRYGLWSEAHRVIGLARRLLSCGGGGTGTSSPG